MFAQLPKLSYLLVISQPKAYAPLAQDYQKNGLNQLSPLFHEN
jgi:hypothetical protein